MKLLPTCFNFFGQFLDDSKQHGLQQYSLRNHGDDAWRWMVGLGAVPKLTATGELSRSRKLQVKTLLTFKGTKVTNNKRGETIVG